MVDVFIEPSIGDILIDQNGDVQFALGWDEVRQFCERVLLTCPQGVEYNGLPSPADYIFHPDFGVGLPRFVGRPITPNAMTQMRTKVVQAVMSEQQIAQKPAPQVAFLTPAPFTLSIFVDVALTNGQPGTIAVEVTR